jgi:hypothetical protein
MASTLNPIETTLDAIGIINKLDAEIIAEQLALIEAEARALRVLLRSVKARAPATRRRRPKVAVATKPPSELPIPPEAVHATNCA